jgi:serine/threonine protein kinase
VAVGAGKPESNQTLHGPPGIGASFAGKYELKRLIGAGAMGAVYEGRHVDLGKRVAVKVLRPECCDSPEAVGRFRREARAASAIESEYVAQIFDFGSDDVLGLYMVIEYLDGEDLEARLARQRSIPPVETAAIGWQLARGLARAHGAGVIHRDLKPANMFLTTRDDGSLLAKILDFGVSKLEVGRWAAGATLDGDAEPTLTEHGTTLGTPQYMSPEQCQGIVELDGRTDVWSLCAVLYEALAGEPAISDAGGYLSVMQQIVSTDIRPLAKRAPWVPDEFARVVDEGLARDRERRIRDASTLAARLLDACPEAAERRPARAADKAIVAPARTEPASEREPTDPPPSSAEDRVEIFMRSGEVPVSVTRRGRRGGK